MSSTRLLFPVVALLGASSLLRAEEPATQTTPVDTAAAPLPADLPVSPAAPAAAPSPSVTVNLISRLVQKGILTQAEAAEMIKQAEADAATAAQAVATQAAAAQPPAPTADDLRVTYIPEVVRNQMRDQIKQELMAQARSEKWSAKSAPDWTSKFRPFGDIRGRYESTMFPAGNAVGTLNTLNYKALNSGATPFDLYGTQPYPYYNVDQNRQRELLRARLGTNIMLGDGFNASIRIATGTDYSPTSTNQTLGGAPNGTGGNFSKYQVWLDRAFLSYDVGPGDGEELVFLMGRFDNPFFSTEIQWDDDLGFDGLAMRGKVKLTDRVSTFFTAGAFPVYNTDFNFASNQPSKFSSTDKWLAGAQIGIDWKIATDLTAKIGVAYYDFQNIAGKLSTPGYFSIPSDVGNTDDTRPGFAQRGNTYMALRDTRDNPALVTQTNYQYFGLASEFRNLTLTGKLDYDGYDPLRLSLIGEVTKNLAFDSNAINAKALNNRGGSDFATGAFAGGDTAWNLQFQIGKPALENFGDWQAAFGYRYVESDAVVDGFTDSDFGGGTNVQGFTLGGNMALSRAVRCGLRWMSSNEIVGPPLRSDILQFDINAKF